MGCGGCKKRRKAFAHKVQKVKRKAQANRAKHKANSKPAPVKENLDLFGQPKKKKRGMSKRARWLRKKRRAARAAKRKESKLSRALDAQNSQK